MAQSEMPIFDYPQHTIFLLVEAVAVILLTLSAASLVRSPSFRKAIYRTTYGRKPQSMSPTAWSEPAEQQMPFTLPRLKTGMSSKMTMGLKRLDKANWLTIDEHYHTEHIIRSSHLNQHRPLVLQCMPGSEAACSEILDHVSTFLSTRYPDSFTISQTQRGTTITNHLTGENFPLGPENTEPLETAARLAMEDFNLLVKDEEGQYRLQASATLFPAGWTLPERIGGTMNDLHKPVPKWKESLGGHVNRYFDHLTPATAMERHPLFIQAVPELFQLTNLASATKSQQNPGDSNAISKSSPRITPEDIHVRRERQTFTRLPVSGAVLFTVRSYITPITALDDDEVAALLEITGSWSDEMAAYKGKETWWTELKQYARSKGLWVEDDSDISEEAR